MAVFALSILWVPLLCGVAFPSYWRSVWPSIGWILIVQFVFLALRHPLSANVNDSLATIVGNTVLGSAAIAVIMTGIGYGIKRLFKWIWRRSRAPSAQ
jgi:hypothetical protein